MFKSKFRANSIKNDTFDVDIESIFVKLTEIATLKTGANGEFTSTGTQANLTKIQSFILKYSISLLPILLQSKRFSMQKIRYRKDLVFYTHFWYALFDLFQLWIKVSSTWDFYRVDSFCKLSFWPSSFAQSCLKTKVGLPLYLTIQKSILG